MIYQVWKLNGAWGHAACAVSQDSGASNVTIITFDDGTRCSWQTYLHRLCESCILMHLRTDQLFKLLTIIRAMPDLAERYHSRIINTMLSTQVVAILT